MKMLSIRHSSARPGLWIWLSRVPRRKRHWFGHGNATAIGAEEPGARITENQLAFALDNVPLSLNIPHVAGHPYRFVWAEGCDTAAGTFCEAFACPAQNLSTNNFIRGGIWSRVFLGYTTDFHPDLNQDGYWIEESQIIYTLLQNFLSGKSGGIGTQYNLNTLSYDAHYSLGPFYSINYWLHDPTSVFGAGDLLYGDSW